MYILIKVKRDQFDIVQEQLIGFGWRWAGEKDMYYKVNLKVYDNHYKNDNIFYIVIHKISKLLQFLSISQALCKQYITSEECIKVYTYRSSDTIKVALTTLTLLQEN